MQETAAPLFELESYKDLFLKAKYDFEQLDKCVNSYDLFNYLCTINHLHDWVSKEIAIEPPSKFNGTLNIIRLICNRAKHFKKKKAPSTKVNRGFGTGRFGKGKFGIGEPSYFILENNQQINMLVLCRQAIEIWEDFLTENHLLEAEVENSLAKI